MTTFFSKHKTPKLPLFNRTLVIAVTAVLGLLLVISTFLEIKGSNREMRHVLGEQSEAIITALEKGSENAITSFKLVEDLLAEKLLSNARLLEEMDFRGELNPELLVKIANENQIFRINVFDLAGKRVLSNAQGMGLGLGRGQGGAGNAPAFLLETLQQEGNDELVMGFGQRRFGAGKRFAVAKKRRNGGAIVLNINAEEMLEFRKIIGAGRLVKDIGESGGILYVAVQDIDGILLASQGIDSLSTINSDEFLQQAMNSSIHSTRITPFKDTEVFEVVKALTLDEELQGILRVGLSTEHMREANATARNRAILVSAVMLIIAIVIINWIIGGQNYRSLQKAYDRIETYTGSILANMTDALMAVDSDGKINVINKAAESLFGVKAANVLGEQCSTVLDVLCPLLKEGLESGENLVRPEMHLTIWEKDFIVSASVTVLKNSEGIVDTSFAVVKDMTDQKKLEENLKRKDQITAMGHLASGVAHEIRNPLNAISMIAQRFKHEFTPTEEKEEYGELASTMVNQTRRINDIVQQFLKLARPGQLNLKELNICGIINDVVTLSKAQAAQKNIELKLKCDDLPLIQADSDKLQQVLLNLLRNSIDACEMGGHVNISCKAENNKIRMELADDGHGMTQEMQSKIFNMYFTTKQDGTGLGLSIVQQIISLHNGTIEVKSEQGNGTSFIIYLPISE